RAWLPSYGLSNEDIEAVIPLWSDLERRHYPAWRAGEISFQEQRRRRLRDFLPAVGRTVQAARLDAVFAEYSPVMRPPGPRSMTPPQRCSASPPPATGSAC